MNYLKTLGCSLVLLLIPTLSWSQQTQAINLPVQDFSWAVNWLPGSLPVTPHHYDFVCQKTGVTAPIRKALANPPGEVNLTTLFTAADVGTYSCWAEAMTSTNTLIVKSTKADGTPQTIGFELFVEAVAPNRLEMKFRVR